LIVAGVLISLRETRALEARFMTATPESIASDAALMRFAMPRGRAIYQEHCSACHGADLRGDPRKGVPNLIDMDWLYGTGRVGEIERIVLYGIRAGHSKTQNFASMPAFAKPVPYARYKLEPLKPAQVDDVTALIYSFQHSAAVDAATLKRGSDVYHGPGNCFDCHADHASGDSAIGAPNLVDDIWLYGDGSQASIKAGIAGGLAGVCPQWVSRLSAEDIRAVSVFVHASNADSKKGAGG
jgi:cytochrome c oxidase cbb3-type subunit III